MLALGPLWLVMKVAELFHGLNVLLKSMLLEEIRPLRFTKDPIFLLLVGMISEQCGNIGLSWVSNNSRWHLYINMFSWA